MFINALIQFEAITQMIKNWYMQKSNKVDQFWKTSYYYTNSLTSSRINEIFDFEQSLFPFSTSATEIFTCGIHKKIVFIHSPRIKMWN